MATLPSMPDRIHSADAQSGTCRVSPLELPQSRSKDPSPAPRASRRRRGVGFAAGLVGIGGAVVLTMVPFSAASAASIPSRTLTRTGHLKNSSIVHAINFVLTTPVDVAS